MSALNVREFDDQGGVFQRRDVIDEVDDWTRRVEAIYADVESWARAFGLTTARDRAVTLAEELMQRFAVPDHDMPILDIMDGTRPVASLVPRGLWLIGFAGMIDIITRGGTFRRGASPRVPGPSRLILIDPKTNKRSEWGREAFSSALGLVHVDA